MATQDYFGASHLFERQLVLSPDTPQYSMVCSSSGQLLATGGINDATIRVWNIKTGQLVRSWLVHPPSPYSRDENRIYSLTLDSNEKVLVSGGALIQAWNLVTGELLRTFKGGGWALQVEISPNGKNLATFDDEKTIVWDVDKGKRIRRRFGGQGGIRNILISSNNQELIGGDSSDSRIKVWNLTEGQVLRTIEPSGSAKIRGIAISSDSRFLAGYGFHGIKIWNYSTGTQVLSINKTHYERRFYEHLDNVFCSVFSPDGKILLSSGSDGFIQFWDTNTGEHISTLEGRHRIHSFVMSADGLTLVTRSVEDQTIEVWKKTDPVITDSQYSSLIL